MLVVLSPILDVDFSEGREILECILLQSQLLCKIPESKLPRLLMAIHTSPIAIYISHPTT